MVGQENIPPVAQQVAGRDIGNAANLLSEIRGGLVPHAAIDYTLRRADQIATDLWGDTKDLLKGALAADPQAWFTGYTEGDAYAHEDFPETETPAGRALVEVFQRDNLNALREHGSELNVQSYTIGFVIGATEVRAAGTGSTTQGDNA